MQEIIEKLKSLQGILSKKYGIEQELKELPHALVVKKAMVVRLKESYVEKDKTYKETVRSIAKLRADLGHAESDREKFEGRMDQITTAREYDLLEKEIRDASTREQQYRRELQRAEKNLETQKESMEREEMMIQEQEQELSNEKTKIESKKSEKATLLAELSEEEERITPGLDEELLFKFERIVKTKGGEGIVAIRNGVCMGCHMILPNEFVNTVRASEQILFCPYCSKIVFFLDDEVELANSDFVGGAGLSDLVDADDFDVNFEDDFETTEEEESLLEGETEVAAEENEEDSTAEEEITDSLDYDDDEEEAEEEKELLLEDDESDIVEE